MSKLILDIEPGDRIRMNNALNLGADRARRDHSGGSYDSSYLRLVDQVSNPSALHEGEVFRLTGNAAADISALVGLYEVQGRAVSTGDSDEGGTRWLVHDQDERGNDTAIAVTIEDPNEADEDTLIEYGWDAEDPAGVEFPDNAYDAGREDDYGRNGGPLDD